MLNTNAEPYQYQEEMIHIMSPSAYYYHEATLPPPRQLSNTIYPNPPSFPVTPQLCNPFYQKPSPYYSPLPFSRPPPPPHRHHQQQPLPDSGKTQEYSWLMQQIRTIKKKTIKTVSTSVMMRNIPTSISREKLMEIVDKHCIEENKKATSIHQDAVLSEYDFLYLPMDFVRRSNLGYGFVNFTSAIAAMRFYKSFDDFSWKDSMSINSPKICKICPARIQGKDAHLAHFKKSYFRCDTDEFLPVSFSPPRNGSTSRTLPSIVGKRSRMGLQTYWRIKLNL